MIIECTLDDLYKFNKETNYINEGYFYVETQYGLQQIEGVDITAKNSKVLYVQTFSKFLKVSPDHLLYSKKKKNWVCAKDLSTNDSIKTKDGYENVINVHELQQNEDLYDIQVKNVNEFYANNIVSHNSFFVNLPKILYYGKLDRFKKDEISNRMNKHGWIKGLDQISPDTFVTIERTFSPSGIDVFKHGEDEIPCEDNNIGKAGISDYQTYIDLEVTGLPYHIFSNIISLSVNDFKSFISMTPGDKRVIIDKLFAMEIINKMNELIRKDIRDIKFNIEVFDRDIISLKNNIDTAVKELQNLKTRVNEDNTSKVKTLSEKLEAYKPKLEEGYKKKGEWEQKQQQIQQTQRIFIQQKTQIQKDIENINKQIGLYNQEKCPTCATPFNDKRFELLKGELTEQLRERNEQLEKLKGEENKYKVALTKLNEGLSSINNFIINVRSACTTIEQELNRLKINKPQEFLSIQKIISDNKETLKTRSTDKQRFDEEYKYLSILEQLYSDAGVKKKILESYLPTLNREIEYTLNELHFPYSLSFNSEFEPAMYHLGIPISVDTLSTGEKKRADLVILVSIIRMLKRKYPGLNIFMLDEVLSSIDGDGIYDIVGLLQKISKEMNINIFVINHSPLPIETFDYRIEIVKNAGFSDLHIEKFEKGSE